MIDERSYLKALGGTGVTVTLAGCLGGGDGGEDGDGDDSDGSTDSPSPSSAPQIVAGPAFT